LAAPEAVRDQRRQARQGERRRRLLESAMRSFASRGYHETSVDHIVAGARTSKSAFYEFFESKEDCIRQLLEQEGGRLVAAVLAAAETGEGWDHRDRMRRGIAAFVYACARDIGLTRLLLVESVGLAPSVEEVRRQIHGRFAAMVEEEVRRAQEGDPFYAAVDPEVFARAVVGAVNEATAHFVEVAGSQSTDAGRLVAGLNRIFAP
jgi:AcrR family transcriptional regulator